GLQA
ncbi:hypothetical protein AB3S75_016397, partial [Citrus x aurantiifolia]